MQQKNDNAIKSDKQRLFHKPNNEFISHSQAISMVVHHVHVPRQGIFLHLKLIETIFHCFSIKLWTNLSNNNNNNDKWQRKPIQTMGI